MVVVRALVDCCGEGWPAIELAQGARSLSCLGTLPYSLGRPAADGRARNPRATKHKARGTRDEGRTHRLPGRRTANDARQCRRPVPILREQRVDHFTKEGGRGGVPAGRPRGERPPSSIQRGMRQERGKRGERGERAHQRVTGARCCYYCCHFYVCPGQGGRKKERGVLVRRRSSGERFGTTVVLCRGEVQGRGAGRGAWCGSTPLVHATICGHMDTVNAFAGTHSQARTHGHAQRQGGGCYSERHDCVCVGRWGPTDIVSALYPFIHTSSHPYILPLTSGTRMSVLQTSPDRL